MHISTVSPSKFASEPWPFKDALVYEPSEPAPQECVCLRLFVDSTAVYVPTLSCLLASFRSEVSE